VSWIDGPLAGFDVETTGVQVETDRIVTACVGSTRGQGAQWGAVNWLVDPGIEIPESATNVHGITTEAAREKGQDPREAVELIRDALYLAWACGAPLIGFNIVFDLTILDRECRRNGLGEFKIEGPVIDGLVLDKKVDPYRRGSRKLVDTCAHYGIQLDNAHSADADTLGAARLAWKIGRSGLLRDMSLRELYDLQVSAYAQQRSSFFDYLRRKGDEPDDLNTVWPLKPYVETLTGVQS
jgi:DNA polymerase III subunit epsilon